MHDLRYPSALSSPCRSARLVRFNFESSCAVINFWRCCCTAMLCGPSAVTSAGCCRCRSSSLLVWWVPACRLSPVGVSKSSCRLYILLLPPPRFLGLLPRKGVQENGVRCQCAGDHDWLALPCSQRSTAMCSADLLLYFGSCEI